MFKKIMFSLFLVLVSFSLVACGDKEEPRTYVADGVYTAFEEVVTSRGVPELTTVSVTIKDDKLVNVFIDTIQGAAIKSDDVTTGYTFNAKSKKSLGYEYYMFPASGKKVAGVLNVQEYKTWLNENNKKEWFEQAKLLEDAIVKNGVDSVTVITEGDNLGKTNSVAGVTVTVDTYVKLTKDALANAKAGKLLAVEVYQDDIIWATANIDKDGKVTGYKIDVLQGQNIKEDNVVTGFKFNDKSKQELGYAYFMHRGAFGQSYDETAYKAWLKTNKKLEWFEQVAIICEKFEANPYSSFFYINGNYNTELVSGVTITDNKYLTVLQRVFANSKVA